MRERRMFSEAAEDNSACDAVGQPSSLRQVTIFAHKALFLLTFAVVSSRGGTPPRREQSMNDLRIAEMQAIRDDLARTKEVLGTLIMWMAQSANSPIRTDEAVKLMKQLDTKP
jgi:hypothetical protein